MSVYDERPWLGRYDDGKPGDIEREHDSGLAVWDATVERAADRPLLHYFDATLTVREVDELSDALACGLLARGFAPGDRLAVYLQNVPQFVIAMLATWKAGGIMVSVNPMNKAREAKVLLEDSGARALVTHESLYRDVASGVIPETDVELAITTSELEFVRETPALLADVERGTPDGAIDFL